MWQAYRAQAGGGAEHDWGTFHSDAKSFLVLPNRYLTGELYRGILQNNLVTFVRQHFGGNYRYQYDNATPHHVWVVLEFLRTYLGWIGPCNHPYGQLASKPWWVPSSLLDKWAEIAVKCLQCLAARMPRCLVVIIAARGGNIQYWSSIHKTISTDIIMQKFKFVWLYLPQ